MKRAIFAILLCGAAGLSSGCAVCQSCFDYDYPAYGGNYERYDRTHGRVGSAFNDAGAPVGQLPAPIPTPEGEMIPTPMPMD